MGQKQRKPSVLFHASRNTEIKILTPRSEKTRDENEGARVFGTPSRALAGVFIVESDDSWVQTGMMNDTPYVIISDEERYRSLDKGGVVYSLPTDTFECDTMKGLREYEWTSAKPVRPTGIETVTSALDDMLQNGVRVYFVDKETYAQIRSSPDGGESIVSTLTQYQK